MADDLRARKKHSITTIAPSQPKAKPWQPDMNQRSGLEVLRPSMPFDDMELNALHRSPEELRDLHNVRQQQVKHWETIRRLTAKNEDPPNATIPVINRNGSVSKVHAHILVSHSGFFRRALASRKPPPSPLINTSANANLAKPANAKEHQNTDTSSNSTANADSDQPNFTMDPIPVPLYHKAWVLAREFMYSGRYTVRTSPTRPEMYSHADAWYVGHVLDMGSLRQVAENEASLLVREMRGHDHGAMAKLLPLYRAPIMRVHPACSVWADLKCRLERFERVERAWVTRNAASTMRQRLRWVLEA